MQYLVLAMCPGNLPLVRVQTGKSVWFGFQTIQIPEQQRLGGPNLDQYASTHRLSQVWLDLSVIIPGSVFQVFLFIVEFR
jgi:hypothetical protein